MALTMIVGLAARRLVTAGEAADRDLTLYQVAMLAGGASRVSDTALAFLTWSGMIEVRESTDRLVRAVGIETVSDHHPIEVAVLAAIDRSGVRPEVAMAAGRSTARREIGGLDGLVVDRVRAGLLTGFVTVASAAVLVGALWWMAGAGSTTGFVPLVGVVAVVFPGWWLMAGRPRVSRSGRRTLERIRGRYDDDLQIAAIGVTSLPVETAMHVIALYGRDALTGGMSSLRKVITGYPSPALEMRSSLSR
jgi:uncharacterized protein (TIGR04222 family)